MTEQQTRIKMDDGAEINCHTFGEEGPVLLLFHGNGEDHHVFDGLIEALGPGRRIVAVDTRGHGQSGRGERPLNFQQLSHDMFQVMDALGIAEADVVGFSDGANIAMQMGLDRQSRLGRMVWIGGNLEPSGLKPFCRAGIALAYCAAVLGGLFSRRARARAEILALMHRQPGLAAARLRGIRVPTLVMAGEKDLVLPEHTELIANSLPFGRRCVIKEADHFVLRTAPEQAAAEIGQFLSEGARVGV